MRLRARENFLLATLRVIRWFDRRPRNPTELGTAKIERILAVSNTAIGDTLVSTPGLRSLRLAYPDAHISLLLNQAYVPLFDNNPDISEVIESRGNWRDFIPLIFLLRRRRFDLACVFHGNEPQTTPLCYLAGARFIFKLPNANRFRFLLSNREPVSEWKDFGHGIQQRLAVAELAGGKSTDVRMVLAVSDERWNQLHLWLADRELPATAVVIGFQPGASTRSRRWAPARFVELGRRLLATYPELYIVITGSPAEFALASEIARGIDSHRVKVSAKELPLSLLPALLQRCQLLVTGDTGPMHVAIAVGTPVVALFAVADWRKSGPLYDLSCHKVIQKTRTCEPCYSKNCPYSEPICMEQISVAEVWERIEQCLTAKRQEQ